MLRYRRARTSSVGAPHRRERIFIAARHPDLPRLERRPQENVEVNGLLGRQVWRISHPGGSLDDYHVRLNDLGRGASFVPLIMLIDQVLGQ